MSAIDSELASRPIRKRSLKATPLPVSTTNKYTTQELEDKSTRLMVLILTETFSYQIAFSPLLGASN